MFKHLPAQSFFITGTDTGVGKTYVTAQLGQYFQSRGHSVAAMKPIASGSRDDAETLKTALNLDASMDRLNPIYVELPLAPYAAQLTPGSAISKPDALAKIFEIYHDFQNKYEIVLVEGIGGVRVPLWEHYDVIDLITAFQLPVIVVARAGLGTINHTLLTLNALQQNNLPIAGVVLNGFTGTDLSELTNLAVIEMVSKIPRDCFISIPHQQ